MSAKAEGAVDASIRLVAGPELRILEVRKDDGAQEIPEGFQVEFKLDLGLNRLGANVLGIELSMQIVNVPGVSIHVVYRSVFEIENPPAEPKALDGALRQIGGRVAPSLMYPFIREAIVSSLQRALLPTFVPPIVNFATVFDVANLTVPEAPVASS